MKKEGSKILVTLVLLGVSLNLFSQCGCDVLNCATAVDGVTRFGIYRGTNPTLITLSSPAKPNNVVNGMSYDWFYGETPDNYGNTVNLTPDNPGSIVSNYGQHPQYTIDSYYLNYANPAVKEVDFICRTLVKVNSNTTCFYGRKFQIKILDVPNPDVSGNLNIVYGDNTTLTVNNPIGVTNWYKSTCNNQDSLVGTGNSINLSPITTTTYYAAFNNNGYLSSCVPITITVDNTTAITEDITSTKLIFPNPTSGDIAIKGFNNSSQLRITDQLGQIILERKITQNDEYLNLKSFAKAGIYFISISDQNGIVIDNQKIILQ
jgi:hypothetical protein